MVRIFLGLSGLNSGSKQRGAITNRIKQAVSCDSPIQSEHLGLVAECEKAIQIKAVRLLARKLDLVGANEKGSLCVIGGCLDLNESVAPILIERKNIEAGAVTLRLGDVLDPVGKALLALSLIHI